MKALVSAVERERTKVKQQRDKLGASHQKLTDKRQKLVADKKLVEAAAAKLGKAEKALSKKLDDLELISQVM